MTAERYIKRTVYVAKCPCGESDLRESNPPRERLCKCGQWVPYHEQSVIAPDYGDQYGKGGGRRAV